MRITVLASLLAALTVSACTSTSGVDDLGVAGTSSETTASITRLARPVPPEDVAAAMPSENQAALPAPAAPKAARLVAPARPAPVARPEQPPQVQEVAMIAPSPQRFEQPQPAAPKVEEAVYAVPAPSQKPLALVDPGRPTAKNTPFDRQKTYSPRFRDADPVSWGPVKPKHFSVHGVDVSRWQGNIDWATLRSRGANFAYIKATDGGDHLDPMFRKNWVGAGQAGLKRGAYHFFYWCRGGAEQAEWFIRNVPRGQNALPPVIDVEYNHQSSCKKRPSPEKARAKMKAFMDRIEAHYGVRPVIYTSPDFYADNLRGHFKDYPFWLRSTAAHPQRRYGDRDWVFWQYSGTGLSHGVKGEIDLNVFNGNAETWNRWVARNDS